MGRQVLITFQGQTHNVEQWARKYNLQPGTLWRRLHSGMSIKDALFKPKDRSKRILTPAGELTTGQLAQALGMTPGGLRLRRWRGWREHELATPKVVERNPKLTAFGKTQRVSEWAEEIGIARESLYKRFRKGMPLEEALSMPKSYRGGKKITAFGKTQGISQWAREFDINRNTLVSRLRDGLPPEVALTATVESKKGK
jgi:DNA-binding phage protein